MVAAFSLTVGSFVLIGGRLGDVYGHRIVWLAALLWGCAWNLVSGFAKDAWFYDLCRGFAGIGAGIMSPPAIALLARAYPPGLKRNFFFGLFGALAPFGGAGGSVFEVLVATFTTVPWIWWLHAIKNAATFILAVFCIPPAVGSALGGTVDWVGAFLGVSGLILFNFSFNQAPSAGWGSASVIATLLVGIACLVAFSLWEIYVDKEPILPFDIWRAPSFGAVMAASSLSFATLGIWVYYFVQFQFTFRGATPLQVTAYGSPITINGFLSACFAAFLISRVPGHLLFIMGLSLNCLSSILLATAPEHETYWRSTFFSVFFAPFGSDFTFTAFQIFASNSVPKRHQGVAGSLGGTVFSYGIALGVGLAGTVESHTNDEGRDVLKGYRGALYFAIGLSALGLAIVLAWVRVPKDTREGYIEEHSAEKAPKVINAAEA
ncbi:MFS general substrate transporter [Meredithblackwellia eburnea MCA 4105]